MNTYKMKTQTFQIVRESPDTDWRCTSPRTAAPVLRAVIADLDETQEHFGILALDAKGKVIGVKVLSTGTETACLVSPAMVFRAALVLGGTSVLAFHNHPSGDPTPSREDDLLTKRLRQAGETLGLPLADHIVIGDDTYHSFRSSEGWDA